jgi:hypothetical protein
VPKPKPNPETSYYEVTKILFDRSGVEKHLQRLDVVQGENRAADRAAHFDRHMTEEERQEGITHRIRATSRSVYEEWQNDVQGPPFQGCMGRCEEKK